MLLEYNDRIVEHNRNRVKEKGNKRKEARKEMMIGKKGLPLKKSCKKRESIVVVRET